MRRLVEVSLSAPDRAAVEAAARLLKERFAVERVILFGSKARGDDRPDSDIDPLVLTARKLTSWQRGELANALVPVEIEHGVIIELLVHDRADWESGVVTVLPVHQAVESDGVMVA